MAVALLIWNKGVEFRTQRAFCRISAAGSIYYFQPQFLPDCSSRMLTVYKYWLFLSDGAHCLLRWWLQTPWTDHVRNEGKKGVCMIKINCKILDLSPKTGEEKMSRSLSATAKRWQISFCSYTVELGICGPFKKKNIKDWGQTWFGKNS